jgi:hypothetical protein
MRSTRLFFFFAAAGLLLTGCARKVALFGPSQETRIAVMDFPIPETMTDERRIEGRLLGRRDVWGNPNLGHQTADALSRQLDRTPHVSMVPRVQLKYYFADKKKLLEDSLGALDDRQALALLHEAPAALFGRQLGADYILRGRIDQACTARNRTIDHFWSKLELSLELIDCASGELVWTGRSRQTRHWHSMTSTAEIAIERLIQDLDRQFLLLN